MKLTCIFFGTHEFGATVLKELLAADVWNITALVTQPDQPVGRTQTLTPPPVKQVAQTMAFDGDILQPETLKNTDFKANLASYNASFFIIVEYGKLIPADVLLMPRYGCINIHPSLLPQYRGPAPLQQALTDGAHVTGVSIMLIDEGMDSGPILAQKKYAIDSDEIFPELRQRLAQESVDLLLKTIPPYLAGTLQPRAQNHSQASFTHLLTRDDGRVDGNKTVAELYNQWRGLTPWPGIFTEIHYKAKPLRLKLLEVRPAHAVKNTNGKPCSLIVQGNKLFIAAADGLLEILMLQPEGKKAMDAGSFINGFKLG
ncbi:MAG TPA: methionyl-tRNA formyltransferase [Candidatus Magasanikbacteria bacterium]|nr:methionyl-tRNA formyltransferase [Candidatus Magasanikbacteria bacterium]